MAMWILWNSRVLQVLSEQPYQRCAHEDPNLPVRYLREALLLPRRTTHSQAAVPLGGQASQVSAVQPNVRASRRVTPTYTKKAQARSYVTDLQMILYTWI